MTKRRKTVLISSAVIVALLLFAATILPLIVRSQALKVIADETGRKVRIEKVAINPLTLTVTVSGLAIEAVDGGPFVSIGRVRASLGPASLFKGALIISEITIDTPAVSFARLAANSYSFSDIIERQQAKPPKPKSELRFSVNNIRINNGSIDFDDRAVAGGRKHTVRTLAVAVPFLSNIPYLVERYTDPHISAVVNGAPFSFSGKTKPLSTSMETAVHIDLKGISLPEYLAYSPVKPPADLTTGKLTIAADLAYRVSSKKKPELAVKGLFRLDNIAVDLKSGAPLLRLPSLQVTASDLEVFTRRFLFDEISVSGLELFVARNARGEWMYSNLLPPASQAGQKPGTEPAKKGDDSKKQPTLVQVSSFKLADGIIHFSDALPAGGSTITADQIDIAITNFSTETGTSADYELSMLLDKEATVAADGSFSLTPLKVTLSTELSDFKLQSRWPYLAQWLTSPLKGTFDLGCETTFTKEDGVTVTDGHVLVSGLSARYGDKDGFDLGRLEVNGAGYSQKKNALEVNEVKLSKSSIALSRELDGSISVLSLLKSKAAAAPPDGKRSLPAVAAAKAAAASADTKGKPSAAFSYRFNKILIDRLNASFIDKTFEEQPRFTLNKTSLSLTNLSGPKFTPAGLRFAATLNKETPLKANGSITPAPFRYKGNVEVGRLPLRDFEAYFPSSINVFILAGSVDTSMNLDIALKDGRPTGTFKGSAGVRGFHAVDTVAEEDLLKWESLQLDEIQGSLEPFSLALREIALNNVYSRIVIRKDGSLNLQNLVQKADQKAEAPRPATPPAAAAVQPPAAIPPQTAPRKQVRVDAVTIQGGTLAFSDNHLPRHFSSTFQNLGGRISGLSSEDAKFADVDLRGNLANQSPLQITGQINPLRDDLFVDLKISFKDIELSPITPYTSTFLGYTVEKGKLYLDLKYRIDKKKLESENRIFIDQFTFGDKVESDKATRLPVKLGLALLKDRKGEIHLDVPVTGRTDDPKFSIWRLVFQVIQNLLVKAVTSPFSLLSSMFGGGQDFSAVQFGYGASALPPGEEQKLAALATVLLDRPALKVELKGYVDRERDSEAYRLVLLERKIRNEKFLTMSKEGTLKEGDKAESIKVTPEEQAVYLKAVYRKEKFPKPRNVIGLVKDLPPDEMRKLIIANTVIGEPELQTLARERVAAVNGYLVARGKIPAERIFQKNDDIFKAPEKDAVGRSRVELGAIAQ